MRVAGIFLAASLALGGPAFAAERATPECHKLAEVKTLLKGYSLTPLNIGQYHFAEGMYVATPPAGPPPTADNAILARNKGGRNLLVWMRLDCVSETPPTQISAGMVSLILAINPVAGESSDAVDPKDELKL